MANLLKPISYQKGAALAVGSTFLWKALSFVNALLIALYFGTTAQTDLYFYLIMGLGFGISFLQRMNTAVVIPEAQSLARNEENASCRLINLFLFFYVALAFLCLLAGLFTPVFWIEFFSRFDASFLRNNSVLITSCFVLFGLQMLSNYLMSVLEMYRRFSSVLLSPLNALLPMFFLLLAGHKIGIISMVYGFLISNTLQIIAFVWIMKKELQWSFRIEKFSFHPRLKRNLWSNQLIEIANITASMLPLYLLSGLNAGLVSALNYARQLSDSPNEIFTLRVANVSKIQLTENASAEDWQQLNLNFSNTQHFLLFLLVPLAVFTGFFAEEIITLFFKRGNFSLLSVQEAAGFLRPLIWITAFLGIISMQNNLIAAGRKVRESLPYALLCILIFVFAVPFTMTLWGAFAYPYTQLTCCFISLAINRFFFKKYFPQVAYDRSLKEAFNLVIYNLIAVLPALFLQNRLQNATTLNKLLLCGLIFTGILFLVTCLTGDWKKFLRHFKKRI